MSCQRGYHLYCSGPNRPCQCLPNATKLPVARPKGMHGMYNPAEYPEGVPSPYDPVVEVYPNYVHGSDYTRAYFSEPWSQQPYNVLHGLGALSSGTRMKGVWFGAGAGGAVLGLLAAVAVPERKGRAFATGVILGGLVGVMSAWIAVESVSEGPA